MMLVLIVGINQILKSVLLGVGLIAKENIELYTWLLGEAKKAVGQAFTCTFSLAFSLTFSDDSCRTLCLYRYAYSPMNRRCGLVAGEARCHRRCRLLQRSAGKCWQRWYPGFRICCVASIS